MKEKGHEYGSGEPSARGPSSGIGQEQKKEDSGMASTIDIVSSVSRQAAREAELQRLASAVVTSCQADRKRRVADLLAFIGAIHDTPTAKSDWIGR